MNLLQQLWRRLRTLVRFGNRQAELDQEMRVHLELRIEELQRDGLGEDEARFQARREFGHMDSAKEATRDAWGVRFWQGLARDIRFSVKSLRGSPVFGLAVIVTIALCVAANTTILASLHRFVFRMLPFENPDRLVQVFNAGESGSQGRGGAYGRQRSMSGWTQYRDFKEHATLFEGFALWNPVERIVERDAAAQRIRGAAVSADFFSLMGAQPLVGRFFTPEEVDPGSSQLVVLSATSWEDDFQSDPGVLNRPLRFDDGDVYTIIGVAPPSVEALDRECRFFVPYALNSQSRDIQNRYGDGADLWARLKPGVSRGAARAELQSLEARWLEAVADANGRSQRDAHQIRGLDFDLPHPLKNSLVLLQGGALFVLGVACLNVLTLLLGRTGQRQQELAVRHALGANRRPLRQLLLVESATLVTAAVALGLALSWGAIQIVNTRLAALDSATQPIGISGGVLITVLVASAGTTLAMGLIPFELLWRSGWLDRVASSRTMSINRGARRAADWLVVGQVAFAFSLLIGAGLLLRSFNNVLAVSPGFDARNVVKARIDYEALRPFYRARSDTVDLKRRVVAALQEIPGVRSVALSQYSSFQPYNDENMRSVVINGMPAPERSQRVVRHLISRDYFETMGITLLDGRNLRPGDYHVSYIVDEAFRQQFLDGRQAVGAEIFLDGAPPPAGSSWSKVVGVVSRANLRGLEQRDGFPVVYTLLEDTKGSWGFTVLLNTVRPPRDVIRDMQVKLREVDPRLPLSGVETLRESLDGMLHARRGITLLLEAFAGLALLLAAIGIYAVTAYNVLQRRKEIGVRVALGANRKQVIVPLMRQALFKTGVGLTLGLVGAVIISRTLNRLLFDVTALDPATYGAVGVLLLIVALLANYIPARRAARIDPLEVIRAD